MFPPYFPSYNSVPRIIELAASQQLFVPLFGRAMAGAARLYHAFDEAFSNALVANSRARPPIRPFSALACPSLISLLIASPEPVKQRPKRRHSCCGNITGTSVGESNSGEKGLKIQNE